MHEKKLIRKQFFIKRKKKYFEIEKDFFNPLIKIIKKKFKKNSRLKLSIYYPTSFEVNSLKIFEIEYFQKFETLLPIIGKNYLMNFFKWKKNDVLLINEYGILEPVKSRIKNPDIILVPLLAFDSKKVRLGYGKGFYDRYLKKNKKILTVGIAFSFQRHHKLPTNNNDIKLDYILTEKGII